MTVCLSDLIPAGHSTAAASRSFTVEVGVQNKELSHAAQITFCLDLSPRDITVVFSSGRWKVCDLGRATYSG